MRFQWWQNHVWYHARSGWQRTRDCTTSKRSGCSKGMSCWVCILVILKTCIRLTNLIFSKMNQRHRFDETFVFVRVFTSTSVILRCTRHGFDITKLQFDGFVKPTLWSMLAGGHVVPASLHFLSRCWASPTYVKLSYDLRFGFPLITHSHSMIEFFPDSVS